MLVEAVCERWCENACKILVRKRVRALVWERVRAVLQQRKYWHWYENMNACKCYARCPCQQPACMCECAQRQQHFS